jgi:hypothetical protein
MGETTHQIEARIDSARENLGSNLHELERKVRSVTDWKQHFQTSPMTMLGLAFGGGILLATALGRESRGRRGSRGFSCEASDPQPHSGTDLQKSKALETWDNIKGALIGVAATRFEDFVGEVIPGFQDQFQRTEQKTRADEPDVPLPR